MAITRNIADVLVQKDAPIKIHERLLDSYYNLNVFNSLTFNKQLERVLLHSIKRNLEEA